MHANCGHGNNRKLEDCARLNFISAGQGDGRGKKPDTFGRQIRNLIIGDILAVYRTTVGYVGIAQVISKPMDINNAVLGEKKVSPEIFSPDSDMFDNHGNDYKEWLVEVKWLTNVYLGTTKASGACYGLFPTQAVVCSLDNQPYLKQELEKAFNLNFDAILNNKFSVTKEEFKIPEGKEIYSLRSSERERELVKLAKDQPLKNNELPTLNNQFINKMTKKITRPASLVKHGDLILYATSLKVADLIIPNFYSIERLDPENANEKGYQRLLNKGRAKKLADYIVAGQETRDAFLPTSIFMATNKNISFNPSNNTIEIDTNEVCPFNIVDGQHRVEGLKMAVEKDSRVLEFEVPVNIAINLSEIEQMCHFLIVNTTQKSVEEGVAQRIRARLTKAMGIDDTPNLPKWIFTSVQKGEDEKALQYVDFLNSEKDSPWRNRIRMANDEINDGSINQKSFVKAIKKYILVANNPVFNTEPEERQHKIFLNYWKAIANMIGDDEPSVLFKYNGVELFCKFCVPFYNKMVNMPDYKVSTMEALLQQVFENTDGDAAGVGHADFWVKGGTASGLNTGALSKINNEMVKVLHKPIDIQKQKEMDL